VKSAADLSEPLVLLDDVVLSAHIDKIDDRLGSEEEDLVQHLNLLVVPVTITDVLASLEPLFELLVDGLETT